MVFTNIKEKSSIKIPYRNHKLVDKCPLMNGNGDKSPVPRFLTIALHIILRNNVKLKILYLKSLKYVM